MQIAIDPGKTTGVAWRAADGTLRQLEVAGDDIWMVLNGCHYTYRLDLIIVEDFRSRPGPAVSLSAPETIGRIEAWADIAGVPVIRQQPATAKRHIDNDTLRDRGGWARGLPHARDAARHLFLREDYQAGVFPKSKASGKVTKSTK